MGRPYDTILAKIKKHKRYWWTCSHCLTSVQGRNGNLQKHILSTCRKVARGYAPDGVTRTLTRAVR